MPKTKQQKQTILADIKDKLARMKAVVFVNSSKIPVKEINQLRHGLREKGAEYLVAKKTLLKKVFAETDYEGMKDRELSGELAAVFGYEDEVAPAKTISEFIKTHENMKMLGGILEGKFIESEKVMALAKLPSRPELLARVAGSIAAPLSGLVNVLQGNLRGLVCVLNAMKEKRI